MPALPMYRLLTLAAAVVLTLAAIAYQSWLIGILAGATLNEAIVGLVGELAAMARPATKAERRIARAVESAVTQRTQTINRDTGEHAA
jgi:ABC-type siderophore export system fused ATPase/permease subunit